MSSESEIEELRKIYSDGKLIPFVGTGLSYPFSVPDWAALIRKIATKHLRLSIVKIVDNHIGNFQYWEAVDVIKEYGGLSDFQLQEEICDEIRNCVDVELDDSMHNYVDIAYMNFKIYLTTNYDLLLKKYINNSKCVPQILGKATINSQKIFEKRDYPQLWHLHGHVEDTGSIVISKEVYEQLYSDSKYKDLFTVIQGVGTFLFIGFSFNDVYIRDLLSRNNKSLNTTHYIMLETPNDETRKNFANEFNIKVIGYEAVNGNRVSAIREILNKISAPVDSKLSKISIESPIADLLLPNKIPSIKRKTKMETSLFCKKLRIENTGDILLEYCKDCFFMSDNLLRALKKRKFSKDEIRKVITSVYMTYSQNFKDIYAHTKNSNLLLESVMKELENKDFKVINQALDFNFFQKQGFIHYLADDKKYSVWWGEKRNEWIEL